MYKSKGNGSGKKKTTTAKKTVAKKSSMTPAQKKARLAAARGRQVDAALRRMDSELGIKKKKSGSKLSAAQKAKRKRSVSAYANANKAR